MVDRSAGGRISVASGTAVVDAGSREVEEGGKRDHGFPGMRGRSTEMDNAGCGWNGGRQSARAPTGTRGARRNNRRLARNDAGCMLPGRVRVRVIVLVPEAADTYTAADGKPFHDQG
jgi:hypothetical protein